MIAAGQASGVSIADAYELASAAGQLVARPFIAVTLDDRTKQVLEIELHPEAIYAAKLLRGGELETDDGDGGIVFTDHWTVDPSADPPTINGVAVMRPGAETAANIALVQQYPQPLPLVAGLAFGLGVVFYNGAPCNVRVQPRCP